MSFTAVGVIQVQIREISKKHKKMTFAINPIRTRGFEMFERFISLPKNIHQVHQVLVQNYHGG